SSVSYANVTDRTAPTWDVPPVNQVVPYGESFSYQLEASDFSGIQNWWVNDTIHFTIVDGLITNITALDIGTYFINVSIEDIYGNTLFEVFTVTVNEINPPTWTMTPENQILDYGESLSYQLGASDPSGIGVWLVNDTSNFAIMDGLLTNLGTLEAGVYTLNVTVQDVYGNSLSVVITVTVLEPIITTTTPTTSTTPTSPTTPTSDTSTPTGGGSDMTLLLLGGIGAVIVIIIVLVVISKKKG
ncbi:MAG: hypothetical protein ACTSWA_11690, partial [Candidatus Thorarchaeota archaeon]